MARFAGTRAPQIQGIYRSGEVKPPRVQGLKSAGVTTGAGSAASAVSVGSIFQGLRENSDYAQDVVETAGKIKAEERVTNLQAIGGMVRAGIAGAARVDTAETNAKIASKENSAREKGSWIGAAAGIAKAAAPLLLASDEDTKHSIDQIDDALEVLRNLRPVTFYYKEEYSANPERMHHGFIAQEYQKVMPDATYYDETIGKLCIDTVDLIGLLVRANQQLETRITRIEAKQALELV